jgi:hypothetical protein
MHAYDRADVPRSRLPMLDIFDPFALEQFLSGGVIWRHPGRPVNPISGVAARFEGAPRA